MKHTVILSLILTFATGYNSYAQHDILPPSDKNEALEILKECGTEASPENIRYLRELMKNYPDYLEEFSQRAIGAEDQQLVKSIPITVHIVRRSNATGGLSTTQVDNAITRMNGYYQSAGLHFYRCSAVNFINSDTYYDFDSGTEENGLTSSNNVSNTINIYFCNTVTSGSSALCGYAYFPGGPDHILMRNSCTTSGTTLEHEVGHYLALYHTHGTSNCGTTDELVNGSNCATAGDDVCDTPADPNLYTNCSTLVVNSSCNYTGNATDANGQAYNPDTRNIMSYSRSSCRNRFSLGQLARAELTYYSARTYLNCASFNVGLDANNTSSCDTPHTVSFTGTGAGVSSWKWYFGDGSSSTVQSPTHAYANPGTYTVSLMATDASGNTINDYSRDLVVIDKKTLPYLETFEGFTTADYAYDFGGGWIPSPTNTNSAYHWRAWEGGTPSNNTGPNVDHTLGTSAGNFMYAEASGYSNGDSAFLYTPCMNLSGLLGTPFVEFYFHMYAQTSSNMGSLHIDADTGNGWIRDIAPAKSGSQGNAYIAFRISLLNYLNQDVRFRFRAVRANSWQGDIAIDDFRVFDSTSSPLPVELILFDGKRLNKDKNLLSWSVVDASDIQRFELERSSDGRIFETIALINAFPGQKRYIKEDTYTKDAYYRLLIYEKDNGRTYSQQVFLAAEDLQLNNFIISPNPSQGNFVLSELPRDLDLQIDVIDLNGRSILQKSVRAGNDGLSQLNLWNRAKGTYILKIRTDNKVVARKLVIF